MEIPVTADNTKFQSWSKKQAHFGRFTASWLPQFPPAKWQIVPAKSNCCWWPEVSERIDGNNDSRGYCLIRATCKLNKSKGSGLKWPFFFGGWGVTPVCRIKGKGDFALSVKSFGRNLCQQPTRKTKPPMIFFLDDSGSHLVLLDEKNQCHGNRETR